MKYEVQFPIFFQSKTTSEIDCNTYPNWMCKNDPSTSITTIEKWLHLEFGLINRNWNWEWKLINSDDVYNIVIFKFENEEDKVKFILRWL